MKIILNNSILQKTLGPFNDIGFVPTMGGIHEGHVSLIEKSIKFNKKTIVSIFVNPKQFNDIKDFKSYPSNIKNDLAILILENLLLNHKGEKIEDEALYKLGEFYEAKEEYTKAVKKYRTLIEFYSDDILADDAYYRLAKLFETKLNQSQKAKEYYELIIFNYQNSIYFVEARKKFRILRGDEIE